MVNTAELSRDYSRMGVQFIDTLGKCAGSGIACLSVGLPHLFQFARTLKTNDVRVDPSATDATESGEE